MSTGGEYDSRKAIRLPSREFLRNRRKNRPGRVLDLDARARQYAAYTN
ncbi:MAG: hypothetical protein ACREDJ_03675 [Methylocella sp.]